MPEFVFLTRHPGERRDPAARVDLDPGVRRDDERDEHSAPQGFTPSRCSAEHGFGLSQRSAEHGFGLPRRSAEHGFTLIELMVVIVIIGLLTTIVAINVLPSGEKARVEKAHADVELLTQAAEMYRLDNLTYPSGADGLSALVSPPASLTNPSRYRQGGYIRRLPDDPWGHPYRYVAPGKHGAFDIYSTGADGQEGGEGENADIGNWH